MGLMDRIKRPDPNAGYDQNTGYNNGDDYWDNLGSDEHDDGQQDPGAQQDDRGDMGAGVSLSGAALELKIVHPKEFDSAPQIADHLLQHRAVVVNMELASVETRRRLLDFLTGVTYAVGGSLKKVAKDAIILTPSEVDVGDAKLRGAKDSARRADARRPQDEDEADGDEGGEDIADI